jgi:hypothetical protein
LSQKNIRQNKLGQSTSTKQLKIFKFKEKIPAFSARLLALITFFQVFDSNSFFLSDSILIFLLNYCRKAIPNVFLAGLFPFSDFFHDFQEKSAVVKHYFGHFGSL